MPRRCYVEWCFSGYDAKNRNNKVRNKKNKALFRAPRDPELRKKWHDAIGRTTRILSERDSVCEAHFAESDIQRFFETLMPDGSIHRIPRRCKLKPGAIPNVNIPKESDTESKCIPNTAKDGHVLKAAENTFENMIKEDIVINDAKTALDQGTKVIILPKVAVKEENLTIQPDTSSDNSILARTDENDVYTFEKLRMDLTKSCLPEGWAFICLRQEIRFPFWNLKLDATMTVTVKNDMTGTISVPEGITRGLHSLNLNSFDSFIKSLILLTKQMLCEGTGTISKRAEACPILTHYSKLCANRKGGSRCLPCRILRKKETDSERKREKTSRNRILEYQTLLKATKRRNVRLQAKVLKLRTILDNTKKAVSLSIKKMSKRKYMYCPYHNNNEKSDGTNENCTETVSTI